MKYPVSIPNLSGNEEKYVTEAIRSGWVSSKGPYVEKLEESFAKYIGTKHAIACSSGTTALTLAVAALNLPKGSEIIVSDFTMIATAWAVSYNGLTPVFVDCSAVDLNMDPSLIEAEISDRTKAILVTHIYGRPANMKKIMEIAREYNLYVIEDACEAHGATIDGQKVGSFGDMACFSLFANKIITAGEGGLITTNDSRLAWQLQHLKSMAFDPEHTFLHKKIGYNFRMTNMQAAVGLAQLERIDEFLAHREKIRETYDQHLKRWTKERKPGSVMWMYDLEVSPWIRASVRKELADYGIETRPFFQPMREQPMYNYCIPDGESRAHQAAIHGFYIPTHTLLKRENVEEIGAKVAETIRKYENG